MKDSVGKSDGKTIGGNVTFEKGQVRIRPNGGAVDLGANVIPGGGEAEYTIEIWATSYSVQRWSRVFEIPDSHSDKGDYFWTWTHESNPNKWQVKIAGYPRVDDSLMGGIGLGIENHFVVVYAHDNNKNAYFDAYILRDGKVYWHCQKGLWGGMFKWHSAFFLGHSPYPEDATADASYNEVRIWNRALSEDEIMRSTKLGPDKLP